MMTFDSIPYQGSRLDASVELGQRLADQWGVHSLMIQMARDITKSWNTRGRIDEARAIHGFLSRRVRYVPDPHGAEMLSDPVTTLTNGGDCDDQAILAAALLQAIGHDARIGAVTWKGRKDASHAVAVDLTAGCIVDPVSVSPDAWPPAPYEVQAIKYLDKAGQMQTMNGLFSKLVKAVAKPFQKIFPAKTLLGKVVDPLGLTDPSRNLNLVGRVADVVGTAAAVVGTGYLIGAAAGGSAASGFWGTSALGGKIAGAAALKAGGSLFAGLGKAAIPLLMAGAVGNQGTAAQGPGGLPMSPDQAAVWNQMNPSYPGAASVPGSYTSAGGFGAGGSGGYVASDTMPGATVAVEDTLPRSNVIPLVLMGAAALLILTRKKGTRHVQR